MRGGGGWQTDVEGRPGKSGKVAPRLRIESKLQAFTAGLRRHHNMMSNPPQAQQTPLSPSRPAPPPKPVDLRSPTSKQNLRPPIDDRDEEDKDANPPTTPRSFDSHMSGRSGGPNRPLTPTMIAAQNVAAASALMPNKVTQLAARVASHASSETRNSLLLIPGSRGSSPDGGSQPRNSFQMPNSPSFSAALNYMQNMENNDEDKESSSAGGGSGKKREKRRSAAPAPSSFLRPVPEGSAAHHASNGSSAPIVNAPPPRGDSLLKSGPRTHLATPMTPQRGMKRRSASLGDVFKGGGFTPSMAFAATAGGLVGEPPHARKESRSTAKGQTHGRSGSSGSNATNNVAATYQYVNADPDKPAAFLARPQAAPSSNNGHHHHQHGQAHNLSPTPATTAVAVPSSTPSGIKAIIAPPLPARKKHAAKPDNQKSGYGSGGESSSTEFSSTPKGSGSVLKNNIKGRLAAWTAANASNQNPQSTRQGGAPGRLPPSAYALQSSPSTTTSSSPATPSSALPNQNDYARGRSNSHALTSNGMVPSTPNPKRMTAQLGNVRLTPQHPSQTSLHSNTSSSGPTAAYVANVAVNTAGSIGAAAGGMAMQLGRKVGNFLGHRVGGNSQSGNWGGLAGYMSAGEDGGAGFGFHSYNPKERESHDGGTGAMSDSGHGHGGHHIKLLGTM
ncbi:hypothetical protein FRC00_012896, partial [Tulasnella sp. 408]